MANEEILSKQKSRIQWLKEGDTNSGFLHSQMKNRWNQNKILAIMNADGTLRTGQKEIQDIAVNHFQALLRTSLPVVGLGNLYLESPKCVSVVQAAALERDITDEEIYTTLKSMKKNKSPDDFNVNFFLHCWVIVGSTFTLVVQSFFKKGCLLRGTNSTAIILVPKVAQPLTMFDNRPI